MIYDNSTVRRQDRLLDQERAIELLRTAEYGTLSMIEPYNRHRRRAKSLGPLLLTLFVLFMAIGCGGNQNRIHNGDLIFVGLPVGYDTETGSMDEAISSATGEEGALNLIHVAIAEVKADSVWIIDATIAHGVDRHSLDTFLKDFTLKDGSYPTFLVKRVKGVDADAAVERAKTYCGRSYDVRFLPDNEELYCSELVQNSYLDADGKPIFESEPMNFKAQDGTMPPYWEWLFAQLGAEVPQGLPGTNPQKMSEATCLVNVCTNNLTLSKCCHENKY